MASVGFGVSIYPRYDYCVVLFEELILRSRHATVPPWEDELGRFRVWAGNVGLRQGGRKSLDYQLREASHLSQIVSQLLDSLSVTLSAGIVALPPMVVKAPDITVKHFEKASDGADIQTAFSDIIDMIDDLYDIIPTLLNPAPHDRIVDPLSKTILLPDKSFDLRHARDKFPAASEDLVARLGAANWSRRVRLNYMEKKQEEKIKQIARAMVDDRRSLATSKPTISTAISTAPSTVLPSIFGDHHSDCNSDSDASGASATSYAATVTKEPDGPIRVPRPPVGFYNNQAFDCPYCFTTLTHVRSLKSWKRHVFEDLKPYVCTFGDCLETGKLFTRRRLWFKHELSLHRAHWVCNGPNCGEKLKTKSAFEGHMRQNHKGTFGEKQLPAIAEICKRNTESSACPLCLRQFSTWKVMRHHLGGEMEELALFTLPKSDALTDDPDSQEASDDSSVASSINSTRLQLLVDDWQRDDVEAEDNGEREGHSGGDGNDGDGRDSGRNKAFDIRAPDPHFLDELGPVVKGEVPPDVESTPTRKMPTMDKQTVVPPPISPAHANPSTTACDDRPKLPPLHSHLAQLAEIHEKEMIQQHLATTRATSSGPLQMFPGPGRPSIQYTTDHQRKEHTGSTQVPNHYPPPEPEHPGSHTLYYNSGSPQARDDGLGGRNYYATERQGKPASPVPPFTPPLPIAARRPLPLRSQVDAAKKHAREWPSDQVSGSQGTGVVKLLSCRWLQIGTWRHITAQDEAIVISYVPQKALMTYYIVNNSISYKIEYPFSSVEHIHKDWWPSNTVEPSFFIVLTKPPQFFTDSAGLGEFHKCGDFTEDEQASNDLVHHLEGDPSALQSQLEKFIGDMSEKI